MGAIVPAILPTSREDLEEKLTRLTSIEGVDSVQIDIIDGRFASPASWPYSGGSEELAELATRHGPLPHLGKLKLEVDLMVSNPEEVTGSWITLGATRITVHVESSNYLPRLISDLKHKFGYDKDFAPDLLSFGLAIGLATDLSILEPHLQFVDYVQFMGIRSIGKQGQPFDKKVIEHIESFRKKHPDIQTQVDGGVSLATAPELLSAGVDRLIVGSDLWKADDPAEEFNKLSAMVEQYGIYE